jgi:hypothetical protein
MSVKMKTITKILIVALLSLFLIAVAVDSKAGRGRHYGGEHYSRHGHFKYGHGGYSGHKHHRYKKYYSPRKHYFKHRHRPYYRHGHGYGILYGRGLYGYYGYGKYRYYGYPYEYRYYQRSHRSGGYHNGEYQGGQHRLDYDEEFAQGWNLLKRDRPGDALEIFARLALASTVKGGAKVGYSLASAELGKLDKGIWAMRRALRMDPVALHYVAIDDGLRSKVEQVAERYEWSNLDSENDPGGSFMLAAVYYLLEDMEAARDALERNMNSNDTSTSAENLKRLIQQQTEVN